MHDSGLGGTQVFLDVAEPGPIRLDPNPTRLDFFKKVKTNLTRPELDPRSNDR
jgi:hypothetical protein